jgi:FkbM family methyltransferase
MKQRIYEATQRFFERRLNLSLRVERINTLPESSRGFEDHYVPAIDLTLHLDMDQSLDHCYSENIVDEDCFAFLRTHMTPNSTFVDIGANQGIYSVLVLKEFPGNTVVAVEPDPYSIDKLYANVALNNLDASRLTVFENAASGVQEDRELMLNVAGNRAGSSLVVDQRQWTGRDENVSILVKCRPLLDLVLEADVQSISVLKIDIEGFEYPVLEAFLRDAPSSLRPKSLIVEAFGHCIPLVGGSTIELLVQQGYRLVDHDTYNYFFEA